MSEDQALEMLQILEDMQGLIVLSNEMQGFVTGVLVGVLMMFIFFFFLKGAE